MHSAPGADRDPDAGARGHSPTPPRDELRPPPRGEGARRRAPSGWLADLARAAASYPRRNPVTAGYLAVLLASSLLVGELDEGAAAALLQTISTNLDSMARHPVLSLVASALVPAGLQVPSACGLVGCLAWLERRFGVRRAFGVFAAGHVIGTLLSLAVVVLAVRAGRYPEEMRSTLDYGVSYGAIAAFTAVSPFLPRWLGLPWAAFGLLYGFTEAVWYGALPDFATVGHTTAGLTGLLAGLWLIRSRRADHRGTAGAGRGFG